MFGFTAITGAFLAFLAWGFAHAQPVSPQVTPRGPLAVPQGVPPEMVRAIEAQREGFEAYQRCVAEHRREVDLHYAASQVVQFRNQRAMMEAAFARDPQLREKYPGGAEQMGADALDRYRSLGGSARSIAEVEPVATPCPPPAPHLPSARVAPGGSSPIAESRRLTVPPGGSPPQPPRQAPSTVDLQTEDPAKQMDIARRYRHTLGGVPQVADSSAEAMMWYRKAADHGHTPAMKEIGDIYATGGVGVRRDAGEAERWYRRAADKGDPDAMVALGKFLTPDAPVFGRRDDKEAARWYRKAAEKGHALGMYHFAEALQNGRGVAMDKAAALEWYRRAAEHGNAVAASWVAMSENCKRTGKPPASCL